ncbi:hypothetical protein TWF718_002840 [Orbilia javanica]|uniref:F-box domain-containing protein n=1 Tax=Orbilia javanica TaxID=47235 RepID=A0AAN8MF35_9PEZI
MDLAHSAPGQPQSMLQQLSPPPDIPQNGGYLITDLPTEIIQMIAKELVPTAPGQRCRDLNSFSQTSSRLRSVAYPMVNRHLWFDEEIQYPDTMLNIVNYAFTDPLVEFIKTATFRLRAEHGYWLRLTDTDNEIIKTEMDELRGHLKFKATQGIEVFRFFESHLEEYGVTMLATILLYQLKDLQEVELACSINAMSTRFLLTTLHHFDPPFKLERLGMTRLVDFATASYLLLERFLRLGVPQVGIDSRFASTNNAPKIRPIADFSSDAETDESPESLREGYQDSLSEGSVETEYREAIPFYNRTLKTLARTVEQEIEQDYNGYEAFGHRDCGYETGITYDHLGASSASENGELLSIKDLRLWLDETPLLEYEPLIPLLQRARGIRNLELNLFPSVQFVGSTEYTDSPTFNFLGEILEGQIETLNSLTIRLSWLNAPQPEIPPLKKFQNLRRIHLFYGRDTHRKFTSYKNVGETFFEYMFPQQLEFLRVDLFKYNPCIEFITEAVKIPNIRFPRLRIALGIAKGRVSGDVSLAIGKIWTSLPYTEDPVSGEWRNKVESRSGSTSWRRTNMNCVPVQILAHGSRHRDVFCSEEGWNGPFQSHVAIDIPYSSRHSSDTGSSNESGTGEPQGPGLSPWKGTSQELDFIVEVS